MRVGASRVTWRGRGSHVPRRPGKLAWSGKRPQPSTGRWGTAVSYSKPEFSGGNKKCNDDVDLASLSPGPLFQDAPLNPVSDDALCGVFLSRAPWPARPLTALGASPPLRTGRDPLPTTQAVASPLRLSWTCLRQSHHLGARRPPLYVHPHPGLPGVKNTHRLSDSPLPSAGHLELKMTPEPSSPPHSGTPPPLQLLLLNPLPSANSTGSTSKTNLKPDHLFPSPL